MSDMKKAIQSKLKGLFAEKKPELVVKQLDSVFPEQDKSKLVLPIQFDGTSDQSKIQIVSLCPTDNNSIVEAPTL